MKNSSFDYMSISKNFRKKIQTESRRVRIARVYFNRMFPRRHDAYKVAFSVAVGVFIGIWPTLGIAIILTVAACAALRLVD